MHLRIRFRCRFRLFQFLDFSKESFSLLPLLSNFWKIVQLDVKIYCTHKKYKHFCTCATWKNWNSSLTQLSQSLYRLKDLYEISHILCSAKHGSIKIQKQLKYIEYTDLTYPLLAQVAHFMILLNRIITHLHISIDNSTAKQITGHVHFENESMNMFHIFAANVFKFAVFVMRKALFLTKTE